jgi:hypothetical protein
VNIYFLGGGGGTDAPSFYIGPDGKIHRVPGWNPEPMADLIHALDVIREAAQIKTPELGAAIIKGTMEFVQKELNTHVKDGGVLVVR